MAYNILQILANTLSKLAVSFTPQCFYFGQRMGLLDTLEKQPISPDAPRGVHRLSTHVGSMEWVLMFGKFPKAL